MFFEDKPFCLCYNVPYFFNDQPSAHSPAPILHFSFDIHRLQPCVDRGEIEASQKRLYGKCMQRTTILRFTVNPHTKAARCCKYQGFQFTFSIFWQNGGNPNSMLQIPEEVQKKQKDTNKSNPIPKGVCFSSSALSCQDSPAASVYVPHEAESKLSLRDRRRRKATGKKTKRLQAILDAPSAPAKRKRKKHVAIQGISKNCKCGESEHSRAYRPYYVFFNAITIYTCYCDLPTAVEFLMILTSIKQKFQAKDPSLLNIAEIP